MEKKQENIDIKQDKINEDINNVIVEKKMTIIDDLVVGGKKNNNEKIKDKIENYIEENPNQLIIYEKMDLKQKK